MKKLYGFLPDARSLSYRGGLSVAAKALQIRRNQATLSRLHLYNELPSDILYL